MSRPSEHPRTDEISLFELISALWNRKGLISALMILSLILGYIYSATKPQVYRAQTVLSTNDAGYLQVAIATAVVMDEVNARGLQQQLFTLGISILQQPGLAKSVIDSSSSNSKKRLKSISVAPQIPPPGALSTEITEAILTVNHTDMPAASAALSSLVNEANLSAARLITSQLQAQRGIEITKLELKIKHAQRLKEKSADIAIDQTLANLELRRSLLSDSAITASVIKEPTLKAGPITGGDQPIGLTKAVIVMLAVMGGASLGCFIALLLHALEIRREKQNAGI